MADPATSAGKMIMFASAFSLTAVSVGVVINGLLRDRLYPNMLTNAAFVAAGSSWVLWLIGDRFDEFAARLEQVELEIRKDVVVMSRNGGRAIRPVD